MRLTVGEKYDVIEEGVQFLCHEDHYVGGVAGGVNLSEGNSIEITGSRGHGWHEAQVQRTERYQNPGGPVIRWRGIILLRGDSSKGQIKLKKKARARA